MQSDINTTTTSDISRETLGWSRKLPVRYDVDIFVAGGGPAGLAAAVVAARQGARVLLVEGQTCFGGMGTAGLVPAFCQFADGVNFLAGGFGEEVYEGMWKYGGIEPVHDRTHPKKLANIRVEALKRLYDDLVVSCKTQFLLQTQLVDVCAEGGHITHVVCAAKSGLFAVKAKLFIDATGDGDLAVWAGAPFEKGDPAGRMMPGTLCSLWAGIDWKTVQESKMWGQWYIPQGVKKGIFSLPDPHLPGMAKVGNTVGGGNIGHTFGVDGTSEASLTESLLHGRKLLLEYERFYKEILKGYENMELVATASLLGIRETRRITGDYVLNIEDFKARAIFPDEIGRYTYPVDVHPSSPDEASFKAFEQEMKTYAHKPGENYGIPYRSLLAKGIDNLLVAGRCISTDRLMQGSVRVMPGCFITGQATGMAAVLAARGKGDVRAIDTRELQKKLKAAGAFLPNI